MVILGPTLGTIQGPTSYQLIIHHFAQPAFVYH